MILIMLVEITEQKYDVVLDLAYATQQNFTGKKVYDYARCYLHQEAEEKLVKAMALAKPLGYRFKIFDAFRPQMGQQRLWDHTPNPTFLMDPQKGSHHTRGIAIDLTLIDAKTSQELDMGTIFDDFTAKAFHTNQDVSIEAQFNRKILLGIMTAAGWDYYENEWWHYQLFKPREYPLIQNGGESESIIMSSDQ